MRWYYQYYREGGIDHWNALFLALHHATAWRRD